MQAVAVEETPAHEMIRSRGANYVTGALYNSERCRRDPLLQTCFKEGYENVSHMLLSHCHLMLVLRAFLTKAKWDLLPDGGINYCSDGVLCVAAVADRGRGLRMEDGR